MEGVELTYNKDVEEIRSDMMPLEQESIDDDLNDNESFETIDVE